MQRTWKSEVINYQVWKFLFSAASGQDGSTMSLVDSFLFTWKTNIHCAYFRSEFIRIWMLQWREQLDGLLPVISVSTLYILNLQHSNKSTATTFVQQFARPVQVSNNIHCVFKIKLEQRIHSCDLTSLKNPNAIAHVTMINSHCKNIVGGFYPFVASLQALYLLRYSKEFLKLLNPSEYFPPFSF